MMGREMKCIVHKRNITRRRQRRSASVWIEAAQLFSFREIEDSEGNVHVVWAHSRTGQSGRVSVRPGECTEFEALENHEHLIDDITPQQFRAMIPALDSLCRALRDALRVRCADRKFHVWGLIQLHGTMMVRFYQEWPGEPPYWTEDLLTDPTKERLIHYET